MSNEDLRDALAIVHLSQRHGDAEKTRRPKVSLKRTKVILETNSPDRSSLCGIVGQSIDSGLMILRRVH
jgi:hypothetical protein